MKHGHGWERFITTSGNCTPVTLETIQSWQTSMLKLCGCRSRFELTTNSSALDLNRYTTGSPSSLSLVFMQVATMTTTPEIEPGGHTRRTKFSSTGIPWETFPNLDPDNHLGVTYTSPRNAAKWGGSLRVLVTILRTRCPSGPAWMPLQLINDLSAANSSSQSTAQTKCWDPQCCSYRCCTSLRETAKDNDTSKQFNQACDPTFQDAWYKSPPTRQSLLRTPHEPVPGHGSTGDENTWDGGEETRVECNLRFSSEFSTRKSSTSCVIRSAAAASTQRPYCEWISDGHVCK